MLAMPPPGGALTLDHAGATHLVGARIAINYWGDNHAVGLQLSAHVAGISGEAEAGLPPGI